MTYVVTEFRGLGVVNEAETVIADSLKAQYCKQAILSVSRENERAVRQYRHFGWCF